eukprot:gene20487-51569_t
MDMLDAFGDMHAEQDRVKEQRERERGTPLLAAQRERAGHEEVEDAQKGTRLRELHPPADPAAPTHWAGDGGRVGARHASTRPPWWAYPSASGVRALGSEWRLWA